MLSRLAFLLAFALPSFFGAVRGTAQEAATRPVSNAALDYWQAIYLMENWNANDRARLDDAATMPLDATNEALVSSTDLRLLHYAAQEQTCDWGLHIDEDGPGTLLPYLSALKPLARMGILAARFDLRDGKADAAVEQWADNLALARHAGADGSGIALRVSYSLEGAILDAAATDLGQLAPPELQHLAQLLKALPPATTLRQAVRFQQRCSQQWLIRKLRGKEDWQKLLAEFTHADRATVHACGDTPEAIAAKLQELDPVYDEMADVVSLPYEQFNQRWPAVKKALKSNPAADLFGGNSYMANLCQEAAIAQAHLALFQAAIALRLGGRDALAAHPDPFGNGQAFEYRPYSGGFQLASKLTDKTGDAVTLTVGSPDGL